MFIFDEPTTGLHFHDIRKLLDAFNALISRGHTVVIIEHNMDLRSSDHLFMSFSSMRQPKEAKPEATLSPLAHLRTLPNAPKAIRDNSSRRNYTRATNGMPCRHEVRSVCAHPFCHHRPTSRTCSQLRQARAPISNPTTKLQQFFAPPKFIRNYFRLTFKLMRDIERFYPILSDFALYAESTTES